MKRAASYCCAPGLTIRTEPSGVRVSVNRREWPFGPHALGILDVFRHPRTIEEAMDILKPRLAGPQDWMDCVSTIDRLMQSGALVGDDVVAASADVSLDHHVVMLNDRDRTAKYLAAIDATVKPGDVVLDLGTGTGVLAVAAAKAGARIVYAVEAEDVAGLARAVADANEVGDRVRVLQSWSTQVDLPEPADVLITEIVGHEPLAESLLEAVVDARNRLLRREARQVPSAVRIYGVPVSIRGDPVGDRIVNDDALARWREWYGIDFGPLLQSGNEVPPFYVRPRLALAWEALSSPILLCDIDLASVAGAATGGSASVGIRAAGRIDAIVEFFELDLAPGIMLTNDPARADPGSSWNVAVWTAGCPRDVSAGEQVRVSYSYRAGSGGPQMLLAAD